jgi:hypothetical protein
MLSLAAMEAWRAANLAALELASTAAVATVSFLNTKKQHCHLSNVNTKNND